MLFPLSHGSGFVSPCSNCGSRYRVVINSPCGAAGRNPRQRGKVAEQVALFCIALIYPQSGHGAWCHHHGRARSDLPLSNKTEGESSRGHIRLYPLFAPALAAGTEAVDCFEANSGDSFRAGCWQPPAVHIDAWMWFMRRPWWCFLNSFVVKLLALAFISSSISLCQAFSDVFSVSI